MSLVLILQLLYRFEIIQNKKCEGKASHFRGSEGPLNRLPWMPSASWALWPDLAQAYPSAEGAGLLLILGLAFLVVYAMPEKVIWMQKWVQALGSFSGLFLFEFLFSSPHSLETSFLLTGLWSGGRISSPESPQRSPAWEFLQKMLGGAATDQGRPWALSLWTKATWNSQVRGVTLSADQELLTLLKRLSAALSQVTQTQNYNDPTAEWFTNSWLISNQYHEEY